MVNIPPIKMVMTGGLFIIVLPTLMVLMGLLTRPTSIRLFFIVMNYHHSEIIRINMWVCGNTDFPTRTRGKSGYAKPTTVGSVWGDNQRTGEHWRGWKSRFLSRFWDEF